MRFSHSQPFTNNHFHFLIIVESVTFWPLLQLLKSVSPLMPHSHLPLMCWADYCCCSHCRCPIIFNPLHHFLTHCILTKPSPCTSINWQLIFTGGTCLVHNNQTTLQTSLWDRCHCTSAVVRTASDWLTAALCCMLPLLHVIPNFTEHSPSWEASKTSASQLPALDGIQSFTTAFANAHPILNNHANPVHHTSHPTYF
jgi:hypothetical protein